MFQRIKLKRQSEVLRTLMMILTSGNMKTHEIYLVLTITSSSYFKIIFRFNSKTTFSVWIVTAGRASPERLRSGFWHFAVHRHQHLRDDRLEVFLADHRQHRARHWVRGRRHRPLPPAGHSTRQGPRPAWGLLPPEPAQPDQPHGYHSHLWRGHLLPGIKTEDIL